MASEFIPVALAQLWQVTLLILFVAAVNRWFSQRRPHLSHLLWLVVLIKCVTPPLWASSGGVFCWLQPEQQVEAPMQDSGEWTSQAWGDLLEADALATADSIQSSDTFAGIVLDEAEVAEFLPPESYLEPARATLTSYRLGELAVAFWLVVSLLVLFGITVRWLRFWKLVRTSPQRSSPELEALLKSLSQQLGIRRRVRLIVTESRVGPAVVGFFRVTVLIPAVVADKLQGNSVTPILTHELLHIRRGDLWVGLLQTLAQTLWWFHPLVWWVGRLTTREAERCCDEEVLGELNCDPASYARALLDVLDLKSQLKPVPVFPGVRPVDVTSQRLERIMSLRQGCRRRSPWWCWLIAIGAAVLTLPGAAFVVSAQEAQQQAPEAAPHEADIPQPVALPDGSPGPPRPRPVTPQFNVLTPADRDNAVKTVVYDLGDFAHLLTGTEAEREQKFKKLVHSRDQSQDSQINWFKNKPVVKTTRAGHRAVRDCLSVFVKCESTPRQFDEFLNSMTDLPQAKLLVELQLITLSEAAFSDVKSAMASTGESGSETTSWMLPEEQFDAILEAAKQASIGKGESDGVSGIESSRLTGLNGRSFYVESVNMPQEAPVTQVRSYQTHTPLPSAKDWTGCKARALPYQRDDGSFWLGMTLQMRSLVDVEAEVTGLAESFQDYDDRELSFVATLQAGQVVVFPGFKINHGDESPHATLMTVRICRHSDEKPIEAVPERQGGAETSVALLHSGRLVFRHGGCRLEAVPGEGSELDVAIDSEGLTVLKAPLTLLLTRTDGFGIARPIQMQAEQCRITQGDSLTVDLSGNVVLSAPYQLIRANADSLLMTIQAAGNAKAKAGIKCLMKNVAMTIQLDPAKDSSLLRAEEISIALDANTFKTAEVSASKVESLRVSDEKQRAKGASLSPVFSRDRQLLSQWDTIRRRRSLQKRVSPKFDRTPLKEVVAWFRTAGDLNIILDEPAIEEEGVTGTTPVTLELNEVAIHSALRLLLEPLNLGLTIDEESGVVIVTSKFRMQGRLVAAAYPVADLVIPKSVVVELSDDGTYTLQSTAQPDFDGVRQVSGIVQDHPQLDLDSISELITTVVEPDSWQEVGGMGTLRPSERTLCLVIRQTQEVHREISDLLDQLRRLQDLQVTVRGEVLNVSEQKLSGLKFETMENSQEHRFAILSKEQAAELRSVGEPKLLPTMTLFNGQKCELLFGDNSSGHGRLSLQPVASADRSVVRLSLRCQKQSMGNVGAAFSALPQVPSGTPVVLDLTGSLPSASPTPGNRTLLLVTSEVVVVEEEPLDALDVEAEQLRR